MGVALATRLGTMGYGFGAIELVLGGKTYCFVPTSTILPYEHERDGYAVSNNLPLLLLFSTTKLWHGTSVANSSMRNATLTPLNRKTDFAKLADALNCQGFNVGH